MPLGSTQFSNASLLLPTTNSPLTRAHASMSSRGGSTRADDNARSQVFAGRKASRVVIIPPEYRRDTYRTEANNLVNDIKTSCSCDVNPIWDQTDRKIRRFELYGAGQSIESATRYLNNWIPRSGHRSKHSAMWAKMSAFNWDDWYVQKVGEMDTARRQMFKGPAPETSQSERRLFTVSTSYITSLACSDERLRPS